MERFHEFLENALLGGFNQRIVANGRTWFARGAVCELLVNDDTLSALVVGMRPDPYCVTMPVDGASGLPDPLDGDCTCPRGGLCKHMAAVLVAYARGGPSARAPKRPGRERAIPFASGAAPDFERKSALSELSRVLDRSRGARETLLPITPTAGLPQSPFVAGFLSPDPPRPPRAERWRVAFAVGLARSPAPGQVIGQQTLVDRPMLFAAMQFVTRTGRAGRVERYRPERITEQPDASTAALLDRILAGGRCAPLLANWDVIRDNPRIPIVACDEEGRPLWGVPYLLRAIREIAIALKPTLEPAGGRATVSFLPVVRIAFEGEEEPPEEAETRWVEAWQGRLLLATASNVIGWMTGEPRYLSLVRTLMARRLALGAADALALQARFLAEQPTRIRLELPYHSVRVVSGTPDTRLVVAQDRFTRDLGVAVHFDYGAEGAEQDGAFTLRVRDTGIEHRTVTALTELFQRDVETTPVVSPENGGAAALLRLRTTLEGFLRLFGEDLLSRGVDLCIDEPKAKVQRADGPIRIMVESGIDWFGLRAEGGAAIDLKSIDSEDELFAAGLVRADGKLLYIGRQEAEKLKKVLALLDPDAAGARVASRDMDALLQLAEIADNSPPDLRRLVDVAKKLAQQASIPQMPPPRHFTATLRSYQQTGYSWLAFLADNGLNGCLADDMGLGKTVQALALLARRKASGEGGTSLVVAPVSTLTNWRKEAARFAPELRLLVHHGHPRERSLEALGRVDLVVVSYATLRMDAELFQGMDFDVVVLDEAQTIKNPLSQSFTVVKGLQARHRFTLTGTPIENSVVDLWSQLDFLEPGLLGSLSRFRREFGNAEGTRVARLRRVIRPFILRRTKDVVESSLPPKEDTTLYAEMGSRQAAAYQAIRKRYRLLVAGALESRGIARSGAVIFEGLLRLRQAACFPAQADPAYHGVPSCKLEVLRDLLEEILAGGHRVLVFSQFIDSLAQIQLALEARGTAYSYLDGSTRDRQAVIDDFQDPKGPPVFLLSLKAGGVGINLTAADYVVIFDPWWNPAVESQAVDRTHRIGQEKSVFVYRIVTRDSVEEQILELQARKRSLARDLIDQDPQSLLSLSEHEILGFFGGE